MQKNQKGFTIIELIVVIAIIAVLATIVMINVTSYIAKGKDAAIKGNLNSLLTNGAIYYSETALGNGDYIGFKTAPSGCLATGPIYLAISNAGSTLVCGETATTGVAWCGCAQLKAETNGYCVDSTGAKVIVSGATGCSTACTDASPGCL
jgi:prepilin-type N-terminal cleavage/methylation domain-containing protein